MGRATDLGALLQGRASGSGRPRACPQISASWFFDAKDLGAGDKLDDKIKSALDQTAIFVALISKSYFHPDCWCNLEREHFLSVLGDNVAEQRRVFGVLLEEDVLEDWKRHWFPSVRAFPFYEKDQATEESARLGDAEIDSRFLREIRRLGKEIADGLKELRDAAPPPDEPGRGAIYLAVVPGDLEADREELAAAICDSGWKVLPQQNECTVDPAECAEAAEAAAADRKAFVQLLGAYPWRPGNYDRAQYEGFGRCKP